MEQLNQAPSTPSRTRDCDKIKRSSFGNQPLSPRCSFLRLNSASSDTSSLLQNHTKSLQFHSPSKRSRTLFSSPASSISHSRELLFTCDNNPCTPPPPPPSPPPRPPRPQKSLPNLRPKIILSPLALTLLPSPPPLSPLPKLPVFEPLECVPEGTDWELDRNSQIISECALSRTSKAHDNSSPSRTIFSTPCILEPGIWLKSSSASIEASSGRDGQYLKDNRVVAAQIVECGNKNREDTRIESDSWPQLPPPMALPMTPDKPSSDAEVENGRSTERHKIGVHSKVHIDTWSTVPLKWYQRHRRLLLMLTTIVFVLVSAGAITTGIVWKLASV